MAGRIYDWLTLSFERDGIFKDVDSIPIGADFQNIIGNHIGSCDVVLVIIGREWARTARADGSLRLNDSADLVRAEVEQALLRNIPVVPVLVSHAEMPVTETLPLSLQPLTRRQAIHVRPDPDFRSDVDRLIRSLKLLNAPSSTTVPNSMVSPKTLGSPTPDLQLSVPTVLMPNEQPPQQNSPRTMSSVLRPFRIIILQQSLAYAALLTCLAVIRDGGAIGGVAIVITAGSLLQIICVATFTVKWLPEKLTRMSQILSPIIFAGALLLSLGIRFSDLTPNSAWLEAILILVGLAAAYGLWLWDDLSVIFLRNVSFLLCCTSLALAATMPFLPVAPGLLSGLATIAAILIQLVVFWCALGIFLTATFLLNKNAKRLVGVLSRLQS